MKEVAELDQELSIEERNLLSVAYKNIIVSYPFGYSLSLFSFPFLAVCYFSFHGRTHTHLGPFVQDPLFGCALWQMDNRTSLRL